MFIPPREDNVCFNQHSGELYPKYWNKYNGGYKTDRRGLIASCPQVRGHSPG